MTLDKFRINMMSYRQSAEDEARSLKNSYITLERLLGLYRKFDVTECRMADQVLVEWVLSEDEGLRFDALALIDELKIASALPALYNLIARLTASTAPGAPYESEKAHRIIARLTSLSK